MKGSLSLTRNFRNQLRILSSPNLGGEPALKAGYWKKNTQVSNGSDNLINTCACWEARLLLESLHGWEVRQHCSSPHSVSLFVKPLVLHPLTCGTQAMAALDYGKACLRVRQKAPQLQLVLTGSVSQSPLLS